MKYYLSYGSNLHLQSMAMRCKNAKVVGKSEIKDHKLVFKGTCDGRAYLTLEKAKGSSVPVAIYKISFFDECALDKYECYPFLYFKSKEKIEINGKKKSAMFYIMRENFGYHVPSEAYLEVCLEGYTDFGFDKKHLVNALKTTIRNLQID